MATLGLRPDGGGTNLYTFNSNNGGIAYSFTAPKSGTLATAIVINWDKTGSPGNWRISIKADSAGSPGLELGYGTVAPGSDITSCALSETATVTAGTKYWVTVLREDGTFDASNYTRVNYPTYAATPYPALIPDANLVVKTSADAGANWSTVAGKTGRFVVKYDDGVCYGYPYRYNEDAAPTNILNTTGLTQRWLSPVTGTISAVSVRAKKIGSPAGDLEINLLDAGDAVLASGTKAVADVGTTMAWHTISGLAVGITAGAWYKINVAFVSGSGDASNCYRWLYMNISPVSADLRSATVGNGTYPVTDKDCCFEITYEEGEEPTVTTQAVSSIQATQATGNGNITDTGGENCDKRGFVYGTTSKTDPGNVAPVSSGYDSYAEDSAGGYGTGAFTKTLTILIKGTLYYVRAYAHNTAGYDYGDEVSFTTTTLKVWNGESWVTPESIKYNEP